MLMLEAIARRLPLESFTIESQPALFETREGKRTPGSACVTVSRSSIAIRFAADQGLTAAKAAYGESSGRIASLDETWSAEHVNDAGEASHGDRLFGTMTLAVRRDARQQVAATRLVIAGAAWLGSGVLGGHRVVAHPLSRDVVSHHDRRMSITVEDDMNEAAVETMARACGFVSGLEVEILRVESYSADGSLMRVSHRRGNRRLGRGPHSPFTGVEDEHRMRAWIAITEAFPRLLKDGVPIDMIVDQISAHNQVAQIHVGTALLLLATVTAAYHRTHGLELTAGAASRREELAHLNGELKLGLGDAEIDRFEKVRFEILDTGFFHKPGYETGRPQQDIKFIRDVAHCVVFRLCGYSGPFYGAERFAVRGLAKA